MPPPNDAACDEPRTSHLELLKAVKVAHEKNAAPGRRDSQHGTCDSQRLVAHDQELVQRWRKPTTSRLLHFLKAVEVAHEVKDASPGRQDTMHETSDSHRLDAHDELLVQSWRTPRTSVLTRPLDAVEVAHGIRHGTSDAPRLVASSHTILNPELLEGADDRGHFAGLSAHPLSVQKEVTVAKAGTEATSKSDGDENAPGLERKRSNDAFPVKPAGKASSKDALRGNSYCGWSYAFA